MKRIAYLVNRYPSVSHTFIRREIAALERAGFAIERITIRESNHGHIDPADGAEAEKTTVLLARPMRLVTATLLIAASRPGRFIQALALALASARRTAPGLKHLAYLAEACALVRLCAARAVSHVHAHFGTNPPAVARLAHRLGGPTYSFTIHGPDEWTDPLGYELANKTHEASFVACISHYTGAQLRRFADPADWGKIVVARCAIDGAFLAEPPRTSEATSELVCVGRLCPAKAQLLLLDAFAEVVERHPDARLTLCGDGEMRAEVERRIAELGLSRSVTITGWIDSAEVHRRLVGARAMVLPSFAEGLPVVIMESLALTRPVITTYIAGIPELVRDGENGWLVPAGDRESLVAALDACLSATSEQIDRMGACGREAVLTQHAADVAVQPLIARFARA